MLIYYRVRRLTFYALQRLANGYWLVRPPTCGDRRLSSGEVGVGLRRMPLHVGLGRRNTRKMPTLILLPPFGGGERTGAPNNQIVRSESPRAA